MTSRPGLSDLEVEIFLHYYTSQTDYHKTHVNLGDTLDALDKLVELKLLETNSPNHAGRPRYRMRPASRQVLADSITALLQQPPAPILPPWVYNSEVAVNVVPVYQPTCQLTDDQWNLLFYYYTGRNKPPPVFDIQTALDDLVSKGMVTRITDIPGLYLLNQYYLDLTFSSVLYAVGLASEGPLNDDQYRLAVRTFRDMLTLATFQQLVDRTLSSFSGKWSCN